MHSDSEAMRRVDMQRSSMAEEWTLACLGSKTPNDRQAGQMRPQAMLRNIRLRSKASPESKHSPAHDALHAAPHARNSSLAATPACYHLDPTLPNKDLFIAGQACSEAKVTWRSCAGGSSAASITLALSCSSKTSILSACCSTASGALMTAAYTS